RRGAPDRAQDQRDHCQAVAITTCSQAHLWLHFPRHALIVGVSMYRNAPALNLLVTAANVHAAAQVLRDTAMVGRAGGALARQPTSRWRGAAGGLADHASNDRLHRSTHQVRPGE